MQVNRRPGTKWFYRGDPAVADFTIQGLTADSTWRTLDMSSIVPIGTKIVRLSVWFLDTQADKYILFRRMGNSNIINVGQAKSQAIAVAFPTQIELWLDDNRLGQYYMVATAGRSGTISVISYGK